MIMSRLSLSATWLMITHILFAQSEVATLSGTVTDATGGILRNVSVTVTNQGTNLSVATATNETGRYVFPSLRPGVYEVSAGLAGFKKFVDSAVTLQVNQA